MVNKQMKIYVASSWRNQVQQEVVNILREQGFDVYDFRNPAPGKHGFDWSEIDQSWQQWRPEELRKYLRHPIAEAGFLLDMNALRDCDACVLVLASGRSAHLEAGYAIGAGKPTVILLASGEPELMYKMTPYICVSMDEVVRYLKTINQKMEEKKAC